MGFSGTRNGLTLEQSELLEKCMWANQLSVPLCIHGDCIGADAEFDALAQNYGYERGILPCTFENMRARCDLNPIDPARVLAQPMAPMKRNREIVGMSDLMLICPPNFKRISSGSGTWATARFSKRVDVRTILIFPDGTSWDSLYTYGEPDPR